MIRRIPSRAFMGAIFLLLTFGGGYAVWRERHGGDEVDPTIVAAVVETKAMALGEVLPITDIVTVAAPTGQDIGRISEIHANEGQYVTRGDVIAVLDTEKSLSVLRDQAKANLQQRKAALAKVEADLASNHKTLQAQLADQQDQLERARSDLETFQRLRNSGTTTQASLLDKQLAFNSAESKVAITQIALARNIEADTTGLRVDEASALADVTSAEAAVAKAESDYSRAFVRAPISGRLLSLDAKVGEQISSSGLAGIGDTTSMMIRAEVFETDLQHLSNGMDCSATSRALGKPLHGVLERIGVRITKQSIVSTDPAAIVDARVVEVWIRLDSSSSERVADLSKLQVRVEFGFAPEEDGDV